MDGRGGRPSRRAPAHSRRARRRPPAVEINRRKYMSYALGIDVGGTFTDAVASDGAGRIVSAKTPPTPPHREVGVMRAIEDIAGELGIGVDELLSQTDYIAHGTTASINTLV